MIKFIFPEKDSFISNDTDLWSRNFGLDEVLELESRVECDTSAVKTRVLIQFDTTEVSTSLVANGISPEFYLELSTVEAFEVPLKYSISAYAVSQSWEMGIGRIFDGNTTQGVSWKWRDYIGGEYWDGDSTLALANPNGGGTYYISGSVTNLGSLLLPNEITPTSITSSGLTASVYSPSHDLLTTSTIVVTGSFIPGTIIESGSFNGTFPIFEIADSDNFSYIMNQTASSTTNTASVSFHETERLISTTITTSGLTASAYFPSGHNFNDGNSLITVSGSIISGSNESSPLNGTFPLLYIVDNNNAKYGIPKSADTSSTEPFDSITYSSVTSGSMTISTGSIIFTELTPAGENNCPPAIIGSSSLGLTTGSLSGSLVGNINGTVNGSMTGTMSGSLVGTLVGNNNGSITGSLTGTTVGTVDGFTTGSMLGSLYGILTGSLFGTVSGSISGSTSSSLSGFIQGPMSGSMIGTITGSMTGIMTGSIDGTMTGLVSGVSTGSASGTILGFSSGSMVGILSGSMSGSMDGLLSGSMWGTVTEKIDTFLHSVATMTLSSSLTLHSQIANGDTITFSGGTPDDGDVTLYGLDSASFQFSSSYTGSTVTSGFYKYDYSLTFIGNTTVQEIPQFFTGSLGAIQHFDYESSDINMNVTNIVNKWMDNTIPNEGFILLHSGDISDARVDFGRLRFFSQNTNTIYIPRLSVKWDDSVHSSSLNEVTDSNRLIKLKNMRKSYREGSVIRVDVIARERYPALTFGNQESRYTDTDVLPATSYYAIQDAESEEFLMDFDSDYTKISADDNGSYFNLNLTGFPQERFFKVLIKVEQDGLSDIFDMENVFKISR